MNVRDRLTSLSSDLRALGYDAEDIAGCVRVRLPLWCSVTFESGPDRIRFVPRFGFSSRDGAVRANFLMFTLLVGLSMVVPVATGLAAFAPVTTGLAASYLVVLLGDIVRYILTESAMNAARVLIVSKAAA
jgi:hypothetical protein